MLDDLNDSDTISKFFTKEDFSNIIKSLIKYEETKNENYFKVRDLKFENRAFYQIFKKMQKVNPKGIIGNSDEKLKDVFKDLIGLYKERGYIEMDLSTRNNIFELEPLIICKELLFEFYENQPKEILTYDRNLAYLERVNELVIKLINKTKNSTLNNNQNSNTVSNSNSTSNSYSYSNMEIKEFEEKKSIASNININSPGNIKELKNKMKTTMNHNNDIKRYFEYKEMKYNKKINYNGNSKGNSKIGSRRMSKENQEENKSNFIL